jgi:hypothetical protein
MSVTKRELEKQLADFRQDMEEIYDRFGEALGFEADDVDDAGDADDADDENPEEAED